MRSYGFWYIKGSSRPYGAITAENHTEFYIKLKEFLKKNCVELCPGTITYQETGMLPDPSSYNKFGLAPGEYNLEAASRAGVQMPGMAILEG